jgi:hypothetical protein
MQATGVTAAIEGLVVGAGDLGHRRQVARKGQGREHPDRLDHVLVDLEAILWAEGAPLDREVVEFPQVVEGLRHLHLEAPEVVCGDAIPFWPLDQMVRTVGQQRFPHR